MKEAIVTSSKQVATKLSTKSVELRCPPQCGCRGKLLATLIDFPEGTFGSGAVLQVACPSKKSRLIRIVL